MKLEMIALWWCYGFGAIAAVGVYGVVFAWAADSIVSAFKIKRAILDWAWHRAKGYEVYKPEIVTRKSGGRIDGGAQ